MTTPPAHLHRQAMDAWQDGRQDEALGLLRDAVRQSVDLEILNDLAVATAEVVDAETARGVLATVLAIDPAHAEARDNLAALARPRRRRRRDAFGIQALRGRLARPRPLGAGAGPHPVDAAARPGGAARAADGAALGHDRRPSAGSSTTTPRTSGAARTTSSRTARCSAARRARIGIGMLANPRRDPERVLHTHDWFNCKIALDVDDPQLRPADRAGPAAARDARRAAALRRLPRRLRGAARGPRLLAAAARAHVGAAGLGRRVAHDGRPLRAGPGGALRPRLRRRLQELVRHALVPGAHRADASARARTS